jgi:predicted Zn-dependent protease
MSGEVRQGTRRFAARAALAASLVVAVGCALLSPRETVPYTGRKRPQLRYSEPEMNVLGAEAYEDISRKHKILTDGPDVARLERVSRRLARASGKKYDWRFRLFKEDKVINAFCLPGGKIGVFTGILPITKDDNGMAVVIGHEIAHAVLQHSNERLSQPLAKQLVGLPTSFVLGVWGSISPGTRKVVMNGLGAGYLVGELLPYTQEHEIEADEVGLVFMQRAGYDLDAAPKLWLRMEASSEGRITDSVSTHPGSKERAANLQRKIEEMEAGKAALPRPDVDPDVDRWWARM